MGKTYSYKVAKDVLSEVEKNRILAVYLSMDNPNAMTNWAFAASEFGSASEASMRVMLASSLRKVADAGGCIGNGAAVKTVRKLKLSDEDGDLEEGRQTKKPRGKSKQAKVKPEVHEDDEAVVPGADEELNDNIIVKSEFTH